jgi:metal-dependent amidase/aminoacylase/carboxypeptidase family protein
MRHPALTAARADAAWLASTRASLHAIPELGYDLPLTSKRVKAVLKAIGVKHVAAARGAAHGVVASLGSGEPVFALRADMDALPIEVRGEDGWMDGGLPGGALIFFFF